MEPLTTHPLNSLHSCHLRQIQSQPATHRSSLAVFLTRTRPSAGVCPQERVPPQRQEKLKDRKRTWTSQPVLSGFLVELDDEFMAVPATVPHKEDAL